MVVFRGGFGETGSCSRRVQRCFANSLLVTVFSYCQCWTQIETVLFASQCLLWFPLGATRPICGHFAFSHSALFTVSVCSAQSGKQHGTLKIKSLFCAVADNDFSLFRRGLMVAGFRPDPSPQKPWAKKKIKLFWDWNRQGYISGWSVMAVSGLESDYELFLTRGLGVTARCRPVWFAFWSQAGSRY